MASIPEAITVVVPSFATVTLIPAPGFHLEGAAESSGSPLAAVAPRTLRVPITASMTVRELAKGAMMRYMLSLRRTARGKNGVVRQLCRTGIVVTDVYLLLSGDAERPTVAAAEEAGGGGKTGTPPTHKVELLSDDCVVQVVQVMRETVHMCFRAANAAAKKSVTSPKQAASTAEAHSTGEDWATKAEALTAARAEDASDSLNIDATTAAVAVGGSSFKGPRVPGRDVAMINALASPCASSTVSDAAPERSNSTPIGARQHSETMVHSVRSTEDSGCDEGEKEKEEQENIALSIAALREREAQRIRWGPEAHKHFADNYVSSPEKIMVGRFKCGLRPPPAVQLNPTRTSSSASSVGSVSETPSPTASKDSADIAKVDRGCWSPPPVGASKKTDSDEEQHRQQRCDDQCLPSTLLKRHRSDLLLRSRSESSSVERISERLASLITTEPKCAQVVTWPAISTAKAVCSAAEEVTVGRQPIAPNDRRQDDLSCLAVTPVDAAVRAGTPPSDPSTVAKPVVTVVARQLSFDEEGDIAPKHSGVPSDPLATTPMCNMRRVIQG
ncbi:hypothetical protein LSCM1_03802 [Leishmania martiniquensis]|uniref:Uncharacterized protein n=1 Tax=Leishmania martiniquensis TaxID=1580590 RepID=A0A836KNL4_9TRYP|nr:hypothetical protein LSCM1_03802 [Leishmania martiniquensis]